MSKIGIRVLALLCAAEGFFYVAYVLWMNVLNRPSNPMTPLIVENWTYAFFVIMLGVGIFFISRAFILLLGGKRLFSDYFVSIFSILLWAIPAMVSFGNARIYFTEAPLSLRPYAYANLTSGLFFTTIGAINILSLIFMRLSRSARAQQEKEGGLFPLSK